MVSGHSGLFKLTVVQLVQRFEVLKKYYATLEHGYERDNIRKQIDDVDAVLKHRSMML